MLPTRGILQIDRDDLQQMSDEELFSIARHEIGHALGIGSLWEDLGLLDSSTPQDTRFTGPAATAEYVGIFANAEQSVPVHIADLGHWRETVFEAELMTPEVDSPVEPLSRITAASLADLGYAVDLSQAEPYAPAASTLPLVSIVATDHMASEAEVDTAELTVTRSSSTASALRVDYTLSGTATGDDYEPLAAWVTIPAGESTVRILVTPVDDQDQEPTESVVVTLELSSAYTIGSPNRATVHLVDNEPSVDSTSYTHKVTIRSGEEKRDVNFGSVLNVLPPQPPTISPIADQTILEDTLLPLIAFRVDDPDTPAGLLTVTATSTEAALVPNQNIVVAGAGADRTVRLTPAANQTGETTITVTVKDADGLTATETFALAISGVNDAPENLVPSAQGILQNTPLTFSTGNLNAISVRDIDAGAGDIAITIGVQRGRLTLVTMVGLTSITGNGTGTISMAGRLTAINAALGGLAYTPNVNFVGADTLSLTTDDLGNTGAGGPKSDSDTVPLEVRQGNRPPVITSGGAVAVPENTVAIRAVTAADADGDPVRFTVSGGDDAVAFGISLVGGALSFNSPTDFENPSDADNDNVYEVEIQASDGRQGGTVTQRILVTVTNVVEPVPDVAITNVSPDPRAGGLGQIDFAFSQPVTGFDLSDLSLTRSASGVIRLLPGSATLTTADNVTWRLGNLTALTAPAGIYELRLTAANSGIRSVAGMNLDVGSSEKWVNGPADANEDGSFDQFDLIQVLQAGKYLSGQPAVWGEGDWNGDGRFDQFDIILAQQTQPAHYRQGPFAARRTTHESADGTSGELAQQFSSTFEQAEIQAVDALFAIPSR